MLSSSSDDILIQRFASQQFVRCLSAYGVHRQQKDNSHHGGTTMVMMIRTIPQRKPLLSLSSTNHRNHLPHCVGRRRSRRRSLVASLRKHPPPASLSPAGICFSQVDSLDLGLGVWSSESVYSSPLPLTMESQQGCKMRFSFKNATILVCFLNLVAVLLLLHGFFAAPKRRATAGHQTDPTQLRYILESEEIRHAMEPLELIKRIKEIEQEAYTEPEREIQQVPKQTAAVDLSKRLKDRAMNDVNSQKALEEWRMRKMERARQREIEKNGTLTS